MLLHLSLFIVLGSLLVHPILLMWGGFQANMVRYVQCGKWEYSIIHVCLTLLRLSVVSLLKNVHICYNLPHVGVMGCNFQVVCYGW